MNFTLVTNLVKQIISAIENSAVSTVRVITKSVFAVTVTNPVKKVEVKGQVTVANQKNVERLIKDNIGATKLVEKAVTAESKLTRSTVVTNFPEPLDLKPLATEISKHTAATKAVSIDVQSLHKPLEALKKIEVSNQPLAEIEGVRLEASKIVKAIKALKLDPKVSVEAPKPDRIVVPPAQVNVEKMEIDYKKIAKAIVDSVPGIDYKKLEKLLTDSIGSISIASGGGRSYSYQTSDGSKTQALVDADKHVQVDVLSAPPVEIGDVTVDVSTLATHVKQDEQTALLTAIEANQLPDSHNVTVDNPSIAVTGTFWQTTQPVSGTVAITNSDITAIKNAVETLDNVVAGSEAQVDVVTLPAITGSVTANAGTNLNTSSLALEATMQLILAELLLDTKYHYHDQETTGTYQYIGSVATNGKWMIKRYTLATEVMRYATGTTDYPTNWTSRASLTYDYVYA